MATRKHFELLQGLFAGTEAGTVDWRAGKDEHSFEAGFGHYSVRLSRLTSKSDPDAHDYRLAILDDHGKSLEEVSDEDMKRVILSPEIDLPDEYVTVEGYMGDLFGRAKRNALGADAALDEILGELGGKDGE